jgi:hypothetical protein
MYVAAPIQQGVHIIEYITSGVLLCVTHSDHLAVPTICKAYNCITTKFPSLNCKIALQMLFKATNDFISPDKLIFTLLIYSAYLQIIKYNLPSFTISQQAQIIQKVINKIRKLSAKQIVYDAFNTRNSLNTLDFASLLINSEV